MRLAAALQPALRRAGRPGQRLRRQRQRLRRLVAAAGLRQARHPADPLHPAPPAGPRQDRAVVSRRARAVPRRGRRHHRRTSWPSEDSPRPRRCWSSTRCSPRGSSRSTTTGCIPRPGRPRWPGGTTAGRPLGHGPAMASAEALTEAFLWSQWRTVTKTATVSLHGNTYQVEPGPGRPEGRAGVLPVRPRAHRGAPRAAAPTARRCRTRSPATPTRKPAPRHLSRHRRRRPGSPTCNWSPTPTTSRSPPTNASASTPSTPPSSSRHPTAHSCPGSCPSTTPSRDATTTPSTRRRSRR